AEGSNPGGGKPTSPTCNNSTVTGLGIQKAGQIFYNGLLKKTSSWNHKAARKATLEAAIALFPGSCTEFNATKAAWNAISVPAATGEPVCGGDPDYAVTLSQPAGTVRPGGSTTVTVNTELTSGTAQAITLSASGLPDGATATFSPATVQAGGSSTLTIATSSSTPEGTGPITITADGTATDHTAQYALTVDSSACPPVTNSTRLDIPDYPGAAVSSTNTIDGCARNASATTKVEVHIVHTYRGDLVLDLIAPDGTAYRLKSNNSDSADDIDTTYTVDASAEAANGTWKLQIKDAAAIDTGYLTSWTLTI
ncbi:proprotein convertase P-domain-containing protein, partial [Amycolatopsis sp. H6(2020)]|nr:proprotein convertase P-domain-containing protein [Amycolatopsis sp. H6(2020)]